MTVPAELIQDLRAHAHEAPATCAALMRRAASELEGRSTSQGGVKHCPPPQQPEATCN
jgi:hypothetical protein